jgi:hypothetical protein
VDFTILVHMKAVAEGYGLRRRQILRSFGTVTFRAGIDEVVIVTLDVAMGTLGQEVVYLVVSTQRQPRLTAQTIDTTEGELVAEPVSVLAVLGIALRSVPANVRRGRIGKRRG